MEIWQAFSIMVPILLASRFAVRTQLRREAALELDAFNEQWQNFQHRFIDESRLTARF